MRRSPVHIPGRPTRRLGLAFVLLVSACVARVSAGPPTLAPASTPQEGARAAYDRVLALRISGIPTSAQRRQLDPVVSSALAAALRAAADAERRHRKATRSREPPLWEGDVFSSLFEGASEAVVDRCQAEGEHAQCAVSLTYRDAFGGTQRWKDRAVLVRERGRWVLDDVAYEAKWAFGNKGTLRANLREVGDRERRPR